MRTEIPMPHRIARLPRNKVGYPVPWFIAWPDGQPDFRLIRPDGIRDAVRDERCWICGQHRGANAAFVIGPMCAVNRVSAEPPSHRDCAIYAARACPFLTTPTMRRRPDLPDGVTAPAGQFITRNPGVALVWVTRNHSPFRAADGSGVLFAIGAPQETLWYAHGREATRDEVLASIDSGLPILREAAEAESPAAVEHLERCYREAQELIPAGA